ncbi:hypothetical protein J6590_064318 [Homalodisca vitripennis]|nr:hypothetical protein J6590_064318 [Homalodisca vitripennis]
MKPMKRFLSKGPRGVSVKEDCQPHHLHYYTTSSRRKTSLRDGKDCIISLRSVGKKKKVNRKFNFHLESSIFAPISPVLASASLDIESAAYPTAATSHLIVGGPDGFPRPAIARRGREARNAQTTVEPIHHPIISCS